MDLSKLTTGDKIVLGTGIVLFITLLALPWHSIDFGFVSENRTAIQSPNSIWGVLALLLTIAVVAVVVVDRLTEASLPDLPVPLDRAVLIASGATLAFLVLKLIVETEFLGFGAWLALLLAAGMAYGSFAREKEAAAG